MPWGRSPQHRESDSGARSGWFPTERDGLSRHDQDVSSDPTMSNGSSCGVFCGARIRRRHGGATWRLTGGTLGATPTNTQIFAARIPLRDRLPRADPLRRHFGVGLSVTRDSFTWNHMGNNPR
jgi:hypothetical protein